MAYHMAPEICQGVPKIFLIKSAKSWLWASPVAQTIKKPPAMWETWVWSLGWEDPLEEGVATHSSVLAWRIAWTKVGYSPRGHKESDLTEQLSTANLECSRKGGGVFTSQMKRGACGIGRLGLGAPLPPHLCPHTYHIHTRTKSDRCTPHRFPVRIKWAMHENVYELQNVIKMWGVSVIASINTYSSQSWWN